MFHCSHTFISFKFEVRNPIRGKEIGFQTSIYQGSSSRIIGKGGIDVKHQLSMSKADEMFLKSKPTARQICGLFYTEIASVPAVGWPRNDRAGRTLMAT
jgi:hypothetical protein